MIVNIKQAETLSGISKRNIRFYEQEGMIHPSRNQENDYREYSDSDIQTLKLIRALRMVDMPLEQIRNIIAGKVEIHQAAAEQELRLKQKAQELETAIRFCRELGGLSNEETMDIDAVLNRMDAPENRGNLFKQWTQDYKKLAEAMHKKAFTFVPDEAVTTPAEFTMALCQYANQNDLNLVITREGMYPEFTIDGIEYTAERYYTRACSVPVATIRCTAVHPEEFEPDLPKWEKRILKMFHYSWVFVPVILLNLDVVIRSGGKTLFTTLEGWILMISVLTLTVVSAFRFVLFTYHYRGR